jgi:hypothetical protein
MLKPVKERFDLQVTAANSTVTKTFELDKSVVTIKGVLVTADKDDLLYYRGAQRIEVNKEEYFPDDYESKLLMSGTNVPPNERFYKLGNVSPGNGLVKVEYTDLDDGRTAFQPYRVSLYLDCEREDDVR